MQLSTFVAGINQAVISQPMADGVVHHVRKVVSAAISEESFILDCVIRTLEIAERCLAGGHAYEPLHVEQAHCWRMALFLWEPGFFNAPHQHNTWSVSGVMHNKLQVAIFQRDNDEAAMTESRRLVVQRGDTGYLIPPCIHALGNPTSDAPSVTLHVFSDSEDRAKRARDTIWYDDVNPEAFYQDPKRPARRDLKTALLLLKAHVASPPANVLTRIFEVGDAGICLDAYKLMLRVDAARALDLGDRLVEMLPEANRGHFRLLHKQLRDSVETQVEFALQQALARLVCSPALLAQVLSDGPAQALKGLPAATSLLLSGLLERDGHRLRVLADLFDQRALSEVLGVLPMSAAALPLHVWQQCWRAYRKADEPGTRHIRSETAQRFGMVALQALEASDAPQEAVAADLLRYELAMLRAGNTTKDVSRRHEGPQLVPSTVVETFTRPIGALVQSLRKAMGGLSPQRNSDVSALLSSAQLTMPGADELLLFYASWHDKQVRAMRVTPRSLLLLSVCDGRTPAAALSSRLSAIGYPETPEDKLADTLKQLVKLGVLCPESESVSSAVCQADSLTVNAMIGPAYEQH